MVVLAFQNNRSTEHDEPYIYQMTLTNSPENVLWIPCTRNTQAMNEGNIVFI